MSIEVVKALLLLVRVCAQQESCHGCPLKDFCGKQIQDFNE